MNGYIDGERWGAHARDQLVAIPARIPQHPADVAAYFGGERRFIRQVFVADVGEGWLAGFVELNIHSHAEGSENPQAP